MTQKRFTNPWTASSSNTRKLRQQKTFFIFLVLSGSINIMPVAVAFCESRHYLQAVSALDHFTTLRQSPPMRKVIKLAN